MLEDDSLFSSSGFTDISLTVDSVICLLRLEEIAFDIHSFIREKNRQDALAAELAPYQQVFLPNIYVDGISLGGMTAQEGVDAAPLLGFVRK